MPEQPAIEGEAPGYPPSSSEAGHSNGSEEYPGKISKPGGLAADSRKVLERALDGFLTDEEMSTLIGNVLASEKRGSGKCPNCGVWVEVAVPDAKAVTKALTDLMTTAKGRPGQAAEGDRELVVVNEIVLAGGDGS